MRYKPGEEFSIVEYNKPQEKTVIEEPAHTDVSIYSMGKDTEVNAESKPCYRVLFLHKGKIDAIVKDHTGTREIWKMKERDSMVLPPSLPIAIQAREDSVCTEILMGEKMHLKIVEAGKPFWIGDLLTYEEGKSVSREVINSGFITMWIVAMDKNISTGQNISTGILIITSIEGEAEMDYEGKTIALHAGKFVLVPKGIHYEIRTHDQQYKYSVIVEVE